MEPLAVRCEQGHAGLVLLEPLDSRSQPQDAWSECVDEHAVQVGTEEVELRRAEMALGGLKQGGKRLPKVVVMRPKLLTKDNLDSATSWADQLAKIKGGSLTR